MKQTKRVKALQQRAKTRKQKKKSVRARGKRRNPAAAWDTFGGRCELVFVPAGEVWDE